MPAFFFLSIVGLFGFFAFEPPNEVTQPASTQIVVVTVQEGGGADAWLRKSGALSGSAQEPVEGTEVTGERGGTEVTEGGAGEEVVAEAQEETPVEGVVEEGGVVEVVAEGMTEKTTPAVNAEGEAAASELVVVSEPEPLPSDPSSEALAKEEALQGAKEGEPQPEVPAMTPEEAIPVPVLVLEEWAGPVASVEEVPTQETTEQNLVEALQEAAE